MGLSRFNRSQFWGSVFIGGLLGITFIIVFSHSRPVISNSPRGIRPGYVPTRLVVGNRHSVFPVSGSEEESREQRHQQLKEALESWDEKLAQLKDEIRKTKRMTLHRAHLQKVLRQLRAQKREVKIAITRLEHSHEDHWDEIAEEAENKLKKMEKIFEWRDS